MTRKKKTKSYFIKACIVHPDSILRSKGLPDPTEYYAPTDKDGHHIQIFSVPQDPLKGELVLAGFEFQRGLSKNAVIHLLQKMISLVDRHGDKLLNMERGFTAVVDQEGGLDMAGLQVEQNEYGDIETVHFPDDAPDSEDNKGEEWKQL